MAELHGPTARARAIGMPSGHGRFLRLPDVIATTGMSRPTIYRRIAAGDFPKQVRLSVQSVGWWECDVVAWLNSRTAAA